MLKVFLSFSGILLFCSFADISFAQSTTTTVSFDSGNQMLTATMGGTPLTAGNASTFGDGAVLRLGYYSAATSSNLFAGTFTALSGQGSANTGSNYNITSIGDDPNNGAGAGTFALVLSFVPGTTTGNNLPAANQILAIQFYNNTTLASSTKYNVVSDAAWKWTSPSNPASTVTISLDDAGITYLGASGYTSLSVPEPYSTAWIVLGVATFASSSYLRSRQLGRLSSCL